MFILNEMFDNGGIECKSFWLNTESGPYYLEYDLLSKSIPESVLEYIKNNLDKRHLNIKHLGLLCCCELVIEVVWD